MVTEQLLKPGEVAAALGLTVRGLAELRRTGRGPLWCRLDGRSIRYPKTDLDAYMRDLRRQARATQAAS